MAKPDCYANQGHNGVKKFLDKRSVFYVLQNDSLIFLRWVVKIYTSVTIFVEIDFWTKVNIGRK